MYYTLERSVYVIFMEKISVYNVCILYGAQEWSINSTFIENTSDPSE